jgi:hypothetical protein
MRGNHDSGMAQTKKRIQNFGGDNLREQTNVETYAYTVRDLKEERV